MLTISKGFASPSRVQSGPRSRAYARARSINASNAAPRLRPAQRCAAVAAAADASSAQPCGSYRPGRMQEAFARILSAAKTAVTYLLAACCLVYAACFGSQAPATARQAAHTPPAAYVMSAAPFAAVTSAAASADLKTTIIYKLQKAFTMNLGLKIAGVIALMTPLVVLSAFVYKWASGQNLKNSLFKTYTILQDVPGADATAEESARANFVINIVHVVGLFSYALVLGIVTDEVQQQVEAFKKGNTRIAESGHTVIMNTNSMTSNFLRQWAASQDMRGRNEMLVLLADQPKDDLDQLVDSVRRECPDLEIMAREGRPYDMADLALVNAPKAHTFVLMDPYGGPEEQTQITHVQPYPATLISLAALDVKDARIIMQEPSDDGLEHTSEMLNSAIKINGIRCSNQVISVDLNELLTEAEIQCAINPGLSKFYTPLLAYCPESAEVYEGIFPKFDGASFGEARAAFQDAILLGFFDEAGNVVSNPHDDAIIPPGVRIFGLAADSSKFKPVFKLLNMGGGNNNAEVWVPPKNTPDMRCKHIIVAAFGEVKQEELDRLRKAVPRGGTITVVSDVPQGRKDRVRWVNGHPASMKVLENAGIHRADTVLITGMDDWGDTEADMQMLSYIARLAEGVRGMTQRASMNPLHVVGSSRGALLESFADKLSALELSQRASGMPYITTGILARDEMKAGYMAQCGIQPMLQPVLQELIDLKGAHYEFVHPAKYLNYGETVEVKTLANRCRQQQETLLGTIGVDHKVRTHLSSGDKLKASEVAKVLVLTND